MSALISQKSFSLQFDESFQTAASWVGGNVPKFFKLTEQDTTAAKVAVAALLILTALVFAIPIAFISLAERLLRVISGSSSEPAVDKPAETIEKLEIFVKSENSPVYRYLLSAVKGADPKNLDGLSSAAIDAAETVLTANESLHMSISKAVKAKLPTPTAENSFIDPDHLAFVCGGMKDQYQELSAQFVAKARNEVSVFLDLIDLSLKDRLLPQYIFSVEDAMAPNPLAE